jgi:hypothetical protein
MSKYLVRHWISADFIAEKVINETEIELEKNNLKQNTIPDGSFSFVMVQQSGKINTTTYEKYDEIIRNSNQDRTSNK